MKKVWYTLFAVGLLVVILAGTKEWWLPKGLSDRWHDAWLSASPGGEGDSRSAVLAEHARLSAAQEKEFEAQIGKEKKTNAMLLAEYENLAGKGEAQ
jgi:hypothetical protein